MQPIAARNTYDEADKTGAAKSAAFLKDEPRITPEQLARELARLTSSMTPADRARIAAVLMGATAEAQPRHADRADE